MPDKFDMKKEWEKTKQQLIAFGKEASKIAQKGEEEIIKFSKRSMIQIDATSVQLRKEKLYYLIGKEYVESFRRKKDSEKLIQHLDELEKVEKEAAKLRRKLGGSKRRGTDEQSA